MTEFEYILAVGEVAEEAAQASKVRAMLEVAYCTQGFLSASYVFQPTEIAKVDLISN
jgi:hypothetical protein